MTVDHIVGEAGSTLTPKPSRRHGRGIRVLHVLAGISRRQGGPALNAIGIARAIRAIGGDNEIFSTDNSEPASSKVHTRLTRADLPSEAAGLDIGLFRSTWPHRFIYSPEMADALSRRAREFDVVHIHSLFLYPQFAAQRAARRAGVPYVVTIHGCLDPALRSRSPLAKRLTEHVWQRAMLNHAAALHFTTESERDLVADLGYEAPSVVIPNGIDWSGFQTVDEVTSDARLQRNPIVLYLGRISHKKGIDLLIQAFASLRERIPNARLVIAGPDDEGLTAGLLALAKTLRVEGAITFTGLLNAEERLSALSSAEVWVLPSRTENFGTGVVEAMAAGVPVVLSPEVNLAAGIAAARAGVVCRRDPAAFADALSEVLLNHDEHERLCVAGRSFARRYDWSEIALDLMGMYEAAALRGTAYS